MLPTGLPWAPVQRNVERVRLLNAELADLRRAAGGATVEAIVLPERDEDVLAAAAAALAASSSPTPGAPASTGAKDAGATAAARAWAPYGTAAVAHGGRPGPLPSSVSVTLEPQMSRTVNVYLKAVRYRGAAATGDPKEVTGQLIVSEVRNADAHKVVTWSTVVCFDAARYLALAWAGGDEVGEDLQSPPALSIAASTAVSRAVSRRPSRDMSTVGTDGAAGGGITAAVPLLQEPPASPTRDAAAAPAAAGPLAARTPSSPSLRPPVFVLDPGKLELGDVEVLHPTRAEITLMNTGDVASPYEIVDLDCDVPPADAERPPFAPGGGGGGGAGTAERVPFATLAERQGVLAPLERRVVPVMLHASDAGRHVYRFAVRPGTPGSRTADVVGSVGLNAVQPVYLHFPTLATADAPGLAEADMGLCYVDASRPYAQVMPLPVENRSHVPLYVTCSSNLAKQVFVFTDAQLQVPVQDTLLPPMGGLTVYIALQPAISAEALQAGQCRLLTGGIRFEVFSAPASTTPSAAPAAEGSAPAPAPPRRWQMAHEVVKFRALIGQALLNATELTFDAADRPVAVDNTYTGEQTGPLARGRERKRQRN